MYCKGFRIEMVSYVSILIAALFCTSSAQLTKNWWTPEVILPVQNVLANENISTRSGFLQNILLHVPLGYYPDAFFFFIHIPKSGGSSFNLRICPNVLSDCGVECGCGNCGQPTWIDNPTIFPNLFDYANNLLCPILSFEMPFEGFWEAYREPARPEIKRKTYMITFIRNPFNYIKSQIGHYIARHHTSFRNGDKSEHTIQCMDAGQHFNESSGCNDYHLKNGQTQWLANGDPKLAMSIIDKLFGVGITEYHAESMCLFQYQLGQFNKKRCHYKHLHEAGKLDNSKIWSTPERFLEFEKDHRMRDMMLNSVRDDIDLWMHALKVFVHRLRAVERATGAKLISPKEILLNSFPEDKDAETRYLLSINN